MDGDGTGVTRRSLLAGAAAGGSSLALAGLGGTALARAAPRAQAAVVPLPTPAQVRADTQRMVDFGPRLTGHDGHNRYVAWLEDEFVKAGLELLPCDEYEITRWTVGRFGLELLDGEAPGPVNVGAYYPRCRETPEAGIAGPLVYGGVAPVPSLNGTDLAALQAGLAAYPEQLSTWVTGLRSTLGGSAQGSILLVDLPLPAPITVAAFLPLASYLHWPGHSIADWLTIDYKRQWVMPGLGVPLSPFAGLGAAGVVFAIDSSPEALAGNYVPFDHGFEELPALYVDRVTGNALRAKAAGRPQALLTLTATREQVPSSSVTAVLPGESEETLILNTHTDGQNFVEENGGVAFVHLARHFASLPASQRLKRTLVFAAWPGHMSGQMPELEGWMAAHQDLVERAAAAMTIEHLGCAEWIDSADKGYHATGENEVFGVWTTQGRMFDVTRDALIDADLARTALLRPPVQFGVGGAFQSAGVPQIGAIAGPAYLLNVSANGEMDKLDEDLAARQTAWLADIAKRLDSIGARELREGDPTLGDDVPDDLAGARQVSCGPDERFNVFVDGRWLELRFFGRRRRLNGVLARLTTREGEVSGLTLELRRGDRVVARKRGLAATPSGVSVVLRRRDRRMVARGAYSLVLRHRGEAVARRTVRAGKRRSR